MNVEFLATYIGISAEDTEALLSLSPTEIYQNLVAQVDVFNLHIGTHQLLMPVKPLKKGYPLTNYQSKSKIGWCHLPEGGDFPPQVGSFYLSTY